MAKKTKKKVVKKAAKKTAKPKTAKKAKPKAVKKAAKTKAIKKAVKPKAAKKAAKPKAVKKKIAKAAHPVVETIIKKPEPQTVEGSNSVNPYLTFNGNCEEAFNFYRSVFEGKFAYLGKFKDRPATPGSPPIPEYMKERIMHVTLPIGNGTVIMGSDSNPMMGDVTFGQQVSLSVNAKSKNEADRLFKCLSQDGIVTMPIEDSFWGAYFGMLTDKYGVSWMINFEKSENR